MSSKKFHYFAYGSNLLKQRLILMNPSAEFKTIGKLKGYKLAFENIGDPTFTRWHGGIANIRNERNSFLWGAVWTLDVQHIKTLDKQESGYRAFDVMITTPDNEEIICRTYTMREDIIQKDDGNGYHRPSPHYRDIIIRGATELQLPAEYLEALDKVEHNGFDGNVSVYDEVMKLLNDTKS